MGLDSYIMGLKEVSNPFKAINKPNVNAAAKAVWDSLKLDADLIGSVKVRVVLAHWCSANQIHGWFVNNVQKGIDNQRDHPVTGEQFQRIMALFKKAIGGEEKAGKILPSMKELFSGDTELDEEYFEKLQGTIDEITRILEDPNYDDWELRYDSSW